MRKTLFLVGTLLIAGRAHALNQSVHYQISVDACTAAGGPKEFCEQVGVAAHNVDDYEFNTLAAHSQMEDGQDACTAANLAIWRVFWFGQQMRPLAIQAAISPNPSVTSALAQDLGRALHTIQDDCAHSGMPNPEHAWKSLDDWCHGTQSSPDVQPEASTCAQAESAIIVDALFGVLEDNGAEKTVLDNLPESSNHLTDYADACHFLGEAATWDGSDRRWDNSIVLPFMEHELVSAITDDNAQHAQVCDSAPDGILVSWEDDVDTSGGAPSCAAIHVFCLGKADEVAATPMKQSASGGCDLAQSPSTPAPLLLLLLVAVLSRRFVNA
jgi:hypothetical protein